MKRLVIYHTTTEMPKYLVTEESKFDELDNVFINGTDDEVKVNALAELLFDKAGRKLQVWDSEFPLNQQPFDKVINIGFIE